MTNLKKFIQLYPAILLLVFVYLFIFPKIISYDNSWAITEVLYLEKTAFKTGTALNWSDLGNSLNYKEFESPKDPRITRPLSNLFQIVDAKFRAWLWQYVLPHPTLSLTWIFSLILTPLFLYLLLRNLGVSINIAFAMTAFYLTAPTSLSHVTELFRPAKPMTDFAIIFIVYWATTLEKNFIRESKPIPWSAYLVFWIVTAFSFYWDETAVLIFFAVLAVTPRVVTRSRYCLVLWLLLPIVTLVMYFCVIPFLTYWTGNGFPDLSQYRCYKRGIRVEGRFLLEEFSWLWISSRNLVLNTLGIIIPDIQNASSWIKGGFILAIIAWGKLLWGIRRVSLNKDLLFLFLVFLVFLFNHLMFVQWGHVWGPFWYGGFWTIFFTIWLAVTLQKSEFNKYILAVVMLVILMNMFQGFLAVNKVYKKNHYYPYSMVNIYSYFSGWNQFYKKKDKVEFTGKELREYIKGYWSAHKLGLTSKQSFCLPAELNWLVLELQPNKKLPHLLVNQILVKHDHRNFINTLGSKDRCNLRQESQSGGD